MRECLCVLYARVRRYVYVRAEEMSALAQSSFLCAAAVGMMRPLSAYLALITWLRICAAASLLRKSSRCELSAARYIIMPVGSSLA